MFTFTIHLVVLLHLLISVAGNGICSKQVQKTRTEPQTFMESYSEHYTIGCGLFNLKRCDRWRTSYRQAIRDQEVTYQEAELYCCSNYTQITPPPNITCNPICETPCQNGYCIQPNVCKCDAGYYEDPNIKNLCKAVCLRDCINGKCTNGNQTCTCNPGYTIIDNKCQPKCNKTCTNGDCTAPDTCTCKSGYKLDPLDKFKCNPICTKDCFKGTCVAPETCGCWNGFILSADKYTCDPVCTQQCLNGNCTAPEICTCLKGYESAGQYECKLIVTKCIHGVCPEASYLL